MIAAWMIWSIGVALLLLLAGLAAERLLEGRRRWAWAAAGTGTVALTAVRVVASIGAESEGVSGGSLTAHLSGANGDIAATGARGVDIVPGPLSDGTSAAFFPVAVSSDSVLYMLDGILLLVWMVLSVGLASSALVKAARVLRRRRSWERGALLGDPVLWSRNTGPGIVGVFRPRVVLPSWVQDAGESNQKLILAHEEEHRRARDGILRLALAALLIAFPWNVFLWAHYRRLCLAIELDCDDRVMRRLPDLRRCYGDLLARVGVRGGADPGLVPVALAERRSFLERRIGRLLSEATAVPMTQAAFLVFAVVLVSGVAIWMPGITEDPGLPDEPVQLSEAAPLAVVEFERGVPVPPVPSPEILPPAVPLPVVPFRQRDETPPLSPDASVMDRPQFVEHTVPPRLAVPWSIEMTLEAEYPPDLRDAGIGGTVVAYLFVNTDGRVSRIVQKSSSGHWALDRVAFRAAQLSRFLPATNEEIPVGMWVEIQVPFTPTLPGRPQP